MSEFALWQQFLLLGLALISLIYVFYFKIWVAIARGSDLIFAAALAVAIASVAAPGLFDRLSEAIVDRSALPEALISADEKVAAIESLPGELIDRALAKIGYEPDPEEAVKYATTNRDLPAKLDSAKPTGMRKAELNRKT